MKQLICGKAEVILHDMEEEAVDLTITSPPYDRLRKYDGHDLDYDLLIKGLWKVTRPGGVVVWVVGDATVNGTETTTSFKQALKFREVGFNLHDTMIFAKNNPIPQIYRNRYTNEFEYMFVFSKGAPTTHNPIMIPTKHPGAKPYNKNFSTGEQKRRDYRTKVKKEKIKGNIWYYTVGVKAVDKAAKFHPAAFPYQLAEDHVLSWSRKGDIVLDPLSGSGTTGLAAVRNERSFIGIEASEEYVQQSLLRIDEWQDKNLT